MLLGSSNLQQQKLHYLIRRRTEQNKPSAIYNSRNYITLLGQELLANSRLIIYNSRNYITLLGWFSPYPMPLQSTIVEITLPYQASGICAYNLLSTIVEITLPYQAGERNRRTIYLQQQKLHYLIRLLAKRAHTKISTIVEITLPYQASPNFAVKQENLQQQKLHYLIRLQKRK